MRLKLDENLGGSAAAVLRDAGHDVLTVFDQDLTASPDVTLIEVCRAEGRCLVTLDLDFGNPLVFRPARYPGIAVLRVAPRASLGHIVDAVQTLALGLAQQEIAGRLWVVQHGRIRVYEPAPDDTVSEGE